MYILYHKNNNSIKEVEETKVYDDLYYLKARIPTKEDIKNGQHTKTTQKFFNNHNYTDAIQIIKKSISKIDTHIPLYDEYSKNVYIINKNKVYDRVIYSHYRFPDKDMFDKMMDRKNELKQTVKDLTDDFKLGKNLGEFERDEKIHYQVQSSSYFIIREYRKLSLMIKFLNSFDLDELKNTYIKVFYYYSNEVGKNITICRRPSFLPHFKHIKPYYSRSELINLALNIGKIKYEKDKYYDIDDIKRLCKIITKNDINRKILLDHQKYIVDKNKIGIVQYYSMQGSYFMNQYMRGFAPYNYKNEILDENILAMWKLINDAPKFDKSYTLYRFIKSDPHLKELKIGDNYIVSGFMSTTRDAFYRSDIYKFGFILIKLKIPKDVKGVALCMETVSHFPDEQEIILSPLSVMRLDKKDENTLYYHIDDNYQSQIKTRYEFTYVGKKSVNILERPIYNDNTLIDFLGAKRTESISMEERIRYFVKEYVNPLYQFNTLIGKEKYALMAEWYDSTEAYENFYAAKTNNGFVIYTIKNNYILFTIEIGEDTEGSYIYVNYYFKYGSTSSDNLIDDKDFIEFVSKLGYYFKVRNIILYNNYVSCDLSSDISIDNLKTYKGGNYCIDFYNYLKYGKNKKRYADIKVDPTTLYPKFDYYDLDRLKETNPLTILKKSDEDEIHQIYVKIYEPFVEMDKKNLADFFIYMVDKHCNQIDELIDKMGRIFKDNNPFYQDYYILDGVSFLYNNEMISSIPDFDESKVDVNIKIKNEYRTGSGSGSDSDSDNRSTIRSPTKLPY
jgi:hypothetical protein